MSAYLLITEQAYVLSTIQDGRHIELARLQDGANGLLPADQPLSESRLEAAIQIAEDWLMPYAPSLQGQVLEVTDASGSLQSGLEVVLSSSARQWTVEELERTFTQLVDLATGRGGPGRLEAHRSFLGQVLLLRELAHHCRVSRVHLNQFEPPTPP
jgi:hypothetical protein